MTQKLLLAVSKLRRVGMKQVVIALVMLLSVTPWAEEVENSEVFTTWEKGTANRGTNVG